MKKYFMLCAMMAAPFLACAGDNGASAPSLASMSGDYIIINYKSYEGTSFIADMKSMRIEPLRDGLEFSGFYITGSPALQAAYDEATGTIGIPAGTLMFSAGGMVQYLYPWDEENIEVLHTPVEYTYQGNDTWKLSAPAVLMSGVEGGELSPYYFSQGSVIRRANAMTENLSYVGWGSDQECFEESRPSYVELNNGKITVYNMLQKDQYGYGCMMEGTYTSSGKATFLPQVIGQSNDGTYKVLAGCIYDESLNKPVDVTDAGGRSEGVAKGTVDLGNNLLEIDPMAIWTGTEKNGYVYINSNKSYFEFVKSVKVTFGIGQTGGVSTPDADGDAREILRIEYYNLAGRPVDAPATNGFSIKRTVYRNHPAETEKVFVR